MYFKEDFVLSDGECEDDFYRGARSPPPLIDEFGHVVETPRRRIDYSGRIKDSTKFGNYSGDKGECFGDNNFIDNNDGNIELNMARKKIEALELQNRSLMDEVSRNNMTSRVRYNYASTGRRSPENVDKNIAGMPRRNDLKLGKFDGSTPVEVFINQVNMCSKYNQWSEMEIFANVSLSLTGNALSVLSDGEKCNNSQQLIDKLRCRYGGGEQSSLYRMQLRNLRRRKNESIKDLCFEVDRLMNLAYPGFPARTLQEMAIDYFIDSLDNADLEVRLRDRDPVDLQEACRLAQIMEANVKRTRMVR